MKEVPLKTKNRIIAKFANGIKPVDISVEERLPLESVNQIIGEWENGYISLELTADIMPEVKELANLMRDREISVNDLVEGYHYYTIFKGIEDEKIVPVVKAISSMDKEVRERFLNTAQKMMSFSKYSGVDYVDIPKALEEMVERGKELQREIKRREMQLQEYSSRLDEVKKEVGALSERISSLSREVTLAEKIRSELGLGDEEKLVRLIGGLKQVNFEPSKLVEVGNALSAISSRGLTVEQFLKVLRYFEELMNLGLSIQTMQRILEDVKKYDIGIDEYLSERAIYVKDKIAYMKSLKELVDAHRRAEKEIRNIDEELERKKAKLGKE
ncbi:MAG: hypothetical protein ACP5UO_05015 [Thermoplasmata archaeon]